MTLIDTMPTQLDVIIPVYNEADNVGPLVLRLDETLTKAQISYHLYFVDDNSSDDTVDVLQDFAKTYPLTILHKKGRQGKAFSILEGAAVSKAPYLAMIDADLQYPPEALPEMLRIAQEKGVAVARRNNYQDSRLRHTLSKGFQWVFGKLLHGLDCDVQSGLKVFKREIIENVDRDDVTAWTLDIPLLTTAQNLGYSIGEIDITFEKRKLGESKIEFISSIREIGGQAISYKLKRKHPYLISPKQKGSMIGAGLVHRGKRFVTHTTLRPYHSALDVLSFYQKVGVAALLLILVLSFVTHPLDTAKVVVAILSFIYFVDVIFNLFLILKSLRQPPEISTSDEEIQELDNRKLPIYTILCPLYREAHVIPQFLTAIQQLDWPKKKLDVQLLLEEDDLESIEAVKEMKLPSYVRAVVVPNSQPKTKPKACNYGLSLAKGEYVVIYDAEDAPDPLQLKKSYIAFQKVGPNIKCLQAKLNYYNPHQNWLTRLFTAEYSLWFDVILTGLQSIETTIPLGGTSNHFRTADLLMLQGWDPFNVTEDCDLGVRLFNQGYKTAIINSTTLEEANSNFKNWLRQRSRWIKGYMQTYLLHMRNPVGLIKNQGIHAFLFQITIGGKISFILINPILWVLTIAYFVLYAYVGPSIEALYPSVIFYMAVTSLLFGNFMFIYYYMIGCAKREHWGLMKWVYLIPLYWLMVSVAGVIALYQLIVKPHYWEKTIHGLHLKAKKEVKSLAENTSAAVLAEASVDRKLNLLQPFSLVSGKIKNFELIRQKLHYLPIKAIMKKLTSPTYREGVLLVFASIGANILNMVTSLYLGRTLSFRDFALLNTTLSLVYLFYIPYSAISSAVNHKTAHLLGRTGAQSNQNLWKYYRSRALLVGLVTAGLWLMLTPFLQQFFNFPSPTLFFLFSPLVLLIFLGAINDGYLRGRLRFSFVGAVVLIEPLVRLLLSFLLLEIDLHYVVYASVPAAMCLAFLVSTWLAGKADPQDSPENRMKEFRFPWSFFALALLSGLSSIAFFSVDNLLAVHFLSVNEAGMYGLAGLVGKIIFFSGSLVAGFILPIVSHKEGRGEKSAAVFRQLAALTLLLCLGTYLILGVGLPLSAPYFFGEKLNAVKDLLPLYGFGILLYTVSQTVVTYHLAKKEYLFSFVSFLLSLVLVAALWIFHDSLTTFVNVMSAVGIVYAVVLFVLHLSYERIRVPLQNMLDFRDLFSKLPFQKDNADPEPGYRVLFFNWRDKKHVWAGGAESYIHEIAERLVKDGYKATIFCGNDGKQPRNEVVNGVQIVRRGGFYTVYFWAFIYYVLRFRPYFDIVIDCENGIPFFTPFYVRKPIFLLIHHIHQNVFRKHLTFPLSLIAALIESDLMPYLYRNQRILTVSESSKQEIADLGLATEDTIEVVNPGITTALFKKTKKTAYPSLVYVGRLRPYKNVHVAVHAFRAVLAKYPQATFTIAGSGDALPSLKRLVKQLSLEDSVIFNDYVSDQEKVRLLGQAWVAVQPSMVEGWGITVIEANASGTPVIASNVHGLRDSVRDMETGILVEPGNSDALANAIELLFKDKRFREKLSQESHNWAQQFDWQRSYEKFLQIVASRPSGLNPSLHTGKHVGANTNL